MANPGSDRSSRLAVTFDLVHGQVRLGDGDTATAVLVPTSVWASLVIAAGPEAARAAGRAFGESLGARILSKLGVGAFGDGSVEDAVYALAEELALVGLGALSLERWGRALVLVVESSSSSDAQPVLDDFVVAVLEGTLVQASRRDVHVRRIARDGAALRTLIGSASTTARVGKWLDDGVPWGDAITRLHTRGTIA